MSRIDISIKDKLTNEWIINRGFCRTPEVEFFCENSNDEILADFDYNIIMGISLDRETIPDFFAQVQYIIDYLISIPKNYIDANYSEVQKKMRDTFLEDLIEGKKFLEAFVKNNNIDNYKIKIVQ